MFQNVFSKMKIAAKYLTFTVGREHLGTAVKGLDSLGFAGFNVTAPHKQTIIPYLHGLSRSAEICGAVNTVYRDHGKLIGDNTDGKGFYASLCQRIHTAEGKNFVIIGAGGAASAIATELVLGKAKEITIVNRTLDSARRLANRLERIADTRLAAAELSSPYAVSVKTDVVVQATTVGLFEPDRAIAVVYPKLEKPMYACDVVFNPVETKFLKTAAAAGLETIDGLGMLVNQGLVAFERWFGSAADPQVMRAALEEAFAVIG
jgi:shikimate dehydrogenase